MELPKDLQTILNDKTSEPLQLLNRLKVILENKLMDPEVQRSEFFAHVQYIKRNMQSNEVIYRFCAEFINIFNLSSLPFPLKELNFIHEYRDPQESDSNAQQPE